ncbi:hypothetical protein CPB83DRAFT_746925, partial [Crepidotus variabilis]
LFVDSNHPQFSTHYLALRSERCTPVLLGPAIPNPSRSDHSRKLWASNMLILFKPWRSPLDLKLPEQTWFDVFTELKKSLSRVELKIIDNMTVLTECGDARE